LRFTPRRRSTWKSARASVRLLSTCSLISFTHRVFTQSTSIVLNFACRRHRHKKRCQRPTAKCESILSSRPRGSATQRVEIFIIAIRIWSPSIGLADYSNQVSICERVPFPSILSSTAPASNANHSSCRGFAFVFRHYLKSLSFRRLLMSILPFNRKRRRRPSLDSTARSLSTRRASLHSRTFSLSFDHLDRRPQACSTVELERRV
jgi:hypothetical protein